MIKQSRKIRLPADLYSRNSFYGFLIEYIISKRKDGAELNLLDIGGYEGKLGWFLPDNAKLTVFDKKAAPNNGKTEYVQGDAMDLPFQDGHFDLVISSDMLEHVEQEKRQRVVCEMLRVSSRYLILGGPFQNIYTKTAEDLVSLQFMENTGMPHPFLSEHEKYGLPDLDKLEKLLVEKSVNYLKLGEGNIYNWYLQQLSIGTKFLIPDTKTKSFDTAFNRFFNENLYELGNFRAPTYRTVLFCDKFAPISRRALMEIIEEKNNFHTKKYFEIYKKIFDDSRDALNIKNTEIYKQIHEVNSLKHQLSEFQSTLKTQTEICTKNEEKITLLESQFEKQNIALSEKNEKIKDFSEKIKQFEIKSRENQNEINLQKKQIHSQDLLLNRLKQELEQSQKSEKELTGMIVLKEKSIQEKNSSLLDLERRILILQESLSEYKHELETVLMSRSWKLVRIYGKIKQTLYTRPKNLVVTALQVLFRMGPKEFFRRIHRKIFKSKHNLTSSVNDYQKFIQENALSPSDIRNMRMEAKNFNYRPLISILMPVYNVPEIWLRKAIKSVQDQIYEKWELCAVDDGSSNSRVKTILKEFASEDSRIRIRFRPSNGGIVKASNTCLKMARGAYIGLLDNDDELDPEALFHVVKALQNTRYDLIYSDEDKLEINGTRVDPFFKPDFDSDLLFNNNYICHFSVMRRKIVEEIGGFRDGTDGSQDYDLFLRLTDKKRLIHHIPKILYHWRKLPGSTAADIDAKPYVHEISIKILTDAIHRRGIRGEITPGLWKGSYRLRRDIVGEPLVSIIIPFRDQVDVLKNCLDSIFAKTTWRNYEILLVNNASELLQTREYIREMAHCPRVKMLHYNAPFNYSAINNFARLKAKGKYLLLLNNDTEIIEADWIQNMLEHAKRPEIGAVGARLLYPNDTVQHAGVIIGVGGAANHAFGHLANEDNGYFGMAKVIRQYSAVTAACMMIRKEVFDEMDGMDEENLAVSFNDVDFCLRLKEKGYNIIYTPYAILYHHESLSRGKTVSFNEEYYLRRRHSDIFKNGDPHYNPNLSRERLDFSLKVMDKVKVE